MSTAPITSRFPLGDWKKTPQTIRRERLESLFMELALFDGDPVQWYGDGTGYFCLICGHVSNERGMVKHDPDAGHCRREMDELVALARYLLARGIRPRLGRSD